MADQDKPKQPIVVLVCCEGKETEPQYYELLIKLRRINTGQARVKIVGNKGQHKALLDKANVERQKLGESLDLALDEIEVWAVCDKDKMSCTLSELEEYADKAGVRLAFTDPRFEAYLLQHFTASSTTAAGKALDDLPTKELQKKLKGAKKISYDKTDLGNFKRIFDREPSLIEAAIKNCTKLEDRTTVPYTTAHALLARLLDLAP